MTLLFYKRCESYDSAMQHAQLSLTYIPGAELINTTNIDKEDGFETEIHTYSSSDNRNFSVTCEINNDYVDLYIMELDY